MRDGIGVARRYLSVTAAVAALAIADGVPAAQQRERFTVSGGDVAIYNLAGEMRVEPGTGSAVVIEVTRGGRDAGALRVETGPKGGRQTLRVIYPSRHVVYRGAGAHDSNTSLDVAADGTWGKSSGLGWLTGQRTTVSTRGEGTEAWADLRILVPRGQKLSVFHVMGETHVGGVEGDLSLDESASSVEVRAHKGRLAVDVGSGGVTVNDVQGDVSVDTGSGSVEVSGVRGSVLALDTGSGGLRGHDLTVDRLVADTGSGGVDLQEVRSPVLKIDTGSGHVDIGLLSDVDDFVADTGSGGVTLTVPSKLGARFDIDTGSGGIEVDVPHETISIEHDHVSGVIGDGRGRIHIDTGSGGVRLLRRVTTSDRSGMVLGGKLLPEIG